MMQFPKKYFRSYVRMASFPHADLTDDQLRQVIFMNVSINQDWFDEISIIRWWWWIFEEEIYPLSSLDDLLITSDVDDVIMIESIHHSPLIILNLSGAQVRSFRSFNSFWILRRLSHFIFFITIKEGKGQNWRIGSRIVCHMVMMVFTMNFS